MPRKRPPPPNPQRAARLAPLLLALAVALVYANALNIPFLLDDSYNIVENPAIRRLRPLSAALNPPPVDMTFHTRPFINLTMCVDFALGGLSPRVYHRTNILFHAAAALALYGLVRRALRGAGLDPAAALALAWAAALLWAVHPLNTAAVNYPSQRGELGVGLFFFLTLYSLHRAADGGRRWPAAAVFSCLLGMGSKESMAAAPVLAMVYDRIFLSDSWKTVFRRRWWVHLLLAATWIWPLSRILTYSPHVPAQGFAAGVLWRYPLTQAWGLARMLRLALWPHPLIFDYGPRLADGLAQVAPHLAIMLTLLAAGGWALARHPRAGFALLCFFALLAPSSSLVPITGQPIAEHRMYAPLAALAVLAALGLRRATPGRPRAFLALTAAWALALGVASRQRNELYGDRLGLWSDTAAKRPESDRAWSGLGEALKDLGRHEEARPAFEQALRLNDHPIVRANLGSTLHALGRHEEALEQFRASLRLDPAAFRAEHGMGLAFAALGRHEEAADAQRRALKLKPEYTAAHFHLARSLAALGRHEEAARSFRRAIELQPTALDAHGQLAVSLLALGRASEARDALNRGERASGAPARARFEFAQALLSAGYPAEGLAMTRRHLELEPSHLGALNNAAWIMATSTNAALRDGAAALRLARRAIESGGEPNPALWGTLAAAQAEAGRFEEAVASARRAAELAGRQGDTNLAARQQLRLKNYLDGHPWRE